MRGAERVRMTAAKAIARIVGGAALAVGLTAVLCAPAQAQILKLKDAPPIELLSVAQSVDPAPGVSPLTLAPAPHRSVQLDANGRWAFRLDLTQPVARDQDFRDVQAGAFYRLGRRIEVGGTVGLNSKTPAPQNLRPQDGAPRVRLETKFKF